MGGHALDDLSATSPVLTSLAEDLITLASEGVEIVVVHGGGPQIADLLAVVGQPSEFHEGLRITPPSTMSYVAMALASVNAALVAALTHAGLDCVGLCGLDGAMIRGRSLGAPWDRAGSIATVSTGILETQWRGGYVPVVSPVVARCGWPTSQLQCRRGGGRPRGRPRGRTLVLLSDIDQLRADPDDAASTLTHVAASRVREMISSGAARDGMRPKMTAALDALSAGAQRVVLANGSRSHAVRDVVHGQIPTTEVVA